MPNYEHEHTEHCRKTTVQPMRKAVPAQKCNICIAWWAGYKAAVTPIGDDNE